MLTGKSFSYSVTLSEEGNSALVVAQLGRRFAGGEWEYYTMDIPLHRERKIELHSLSGDVRSILEQFTGTFTKPFEENRLQSNDTIYRV